jgi:hypothetical protein
MPLYNPNAGKQPPISVTIAISAELEGIARGIVISSQADMQLIGQAATCDEALAAKGEWFRRHADRRSYS